MNRKRNYKVEIIHKNPEEKIVDDMISTKDLKIKDHKYYRIGTVRDIDTDRAERILNSIINSIKDKSILKRLSKVNPLFLICKKNELKYFDRTNDKTDDFLGFSPIIVCFRSLCKYGDIDCELSGCNSMTGFIDESSIGDEYIKDVICHEMYHVIDIIGLDYKKQKIIEDVYNKYNVENDIYGTKGYYMFKNRHEFFAEISTVFCETKYNSNFPNRNFIKKVMPEMYNLLDSIYNVKPNNIKKEVCNTNKYRFNFCFWNYIFGY